MATTPFLGEIQLLAGANMIPNFGLCDGTQLNVQQNTALFSLINNYYGGDGVTTFRVPNLMNRAAVGQGAGPGLTPRRIGDSFGENAVLLSNATMPGHLHFLSIWEGRGTAGRTDAPGNGNAMGNPETCTPFITVSEDAPDATFPQNPGAVQGIGGGVPHENRQPFLALTYGICLNGEIPTFGD